MRAFLWCSAPVAPQLGSNLKKLTWEGRTGSNWSKTCPLDKKKTSWDVLFNIWYRSSLQHLCRYKLLIVLHAMHSEKTAYIHVKHNLEKKSIKAQVYQKTKQKLVIVMCHCWHSHVIKKLILHTFFCRLLLFEDCPNSTMHLIYIYTYSNFIHCDQIIMTNVNIIRIVQNCNMVGRTIFCKYLIQFKVMVSSFEFGWSIESGILSLTKPKK